MPRRFLCALALAATALASSEARAGTYDLDLTSLGEVQPDGTIDPRNGDFRSLASEVGVLVAPRPVDPADTLGLSGFAFSADVGINTISSDADYWKDTANGSPNGVVPTLQVTGRKGLWPGLEVGAGATKIFDSRMWGMHGYAKVALHEGFHHLPIPTIGVRGMFSQLLGAKDLRVTTASVDASISHVFGIGSTFNITPYAGYQALMVFGRSGVIDSTPGTDEYAEMDELCEEQPSDPDADPCFVEGEFVFHRQDVIVRHRPFLGARFIFSVIRIGVEAMFAVGGGSEAEVDLPGGGTETVKDDSGLQQQYTISVGLDF